MWASILRGQILILRKKVQKYIFFDFGTRPSLANTLDRRARVWHPFWHHFWILRAKYYLWYHRCHDVEITSLRVIHRQKWPRVILVDFGKIALFFEISNFDLFKMVEHMYTCITGGPALILRKNVQKYFFWIFPKSGYPSGPISSGLASILASFLDSPQKVVI